MRSTAAASSHPIPSPLGAAAVLATLAIGAGEMRDRGTVTALLALAALGVAGKGAVAATVEG